MTIETLSTPPPQSTGLPGGLTAGGNACTDPATDSVDLFAVLVAQLTSGGTPVASPERPPDTAHSLASAQGDQPPAEAGAAPSATAENGTQPTGGKSDMPDDADDQRTALAPSDGDPDSAGSNKTAVPTWLWALADIRWNGTAAAAARQAGEGQTDPAGDEEALGDPTAAASGCEIAEASPSSSVVEGNPRQFADNTTGAAIESGKAPALETLAAAAAAEQADAPTQQPGAVPGRTGPPAHQADVLEGPFGVAQRTASPIPQADASTEQPGGVADPAGSTKRAVSPLSGRAASLQGEHREPQGLGSGALAGERVTMSHAGRAEAPTGEFDLLRERTSSRAAVEVANVPADQEAVFASQPPAGAAAAKQSGLDEARAMDLAGLNGTARSGDLQGAEADAKRAPASPRDAGALLAQTLAFGREEAGRGTAQGSAEHQGRPGTETQTQTARVADAAVAGLVRTDHGAALATGRAPEASLPPTLQAAAAPSAAVHHADIQAHAMADDGDLRRQMVQAVRLQWREGIGDARLTLKPEYLGEVTISLRVENGGVTAHLNAEVSSVRAWIGANEGLLRQGLAEQGLTLNRLVVTEEPPESVPDRKGRKHSPQEETPKPPPRRREAATFEIMV